MADLAWELGVVSYLNARPLIEDLMGRQNVKLHHAVPASLPAMLLGGRVDAAMVPVIDYLRHSGELELIPDACIASDGETMTVRVYSTVRPEDVEVLWVDGESHTSVVLARVLWSGHYHCAPRVLPYQPGRLVAPGEAVLLIGDKVVGGGGQGFAHDLDLGRLWKEWTGLPFVFATWAGRAGQPLGDLARLLSRARDAGVARIEQIARERGPEHGWTESQAYTYLSRHIKYTAGPRHLEGMNLFFEMASNMGLVEEAAVGGREPVC
jgi:chorismate dehydratase